MAKAKNAPTTRTLILQLISGNTRKITIPADWKMTFGQLIPYQKSGDRAQYQQSSQGSSVALRFYKGNKENLMAVYTDVRSFRDATMVVLEKRTTTKSQVVQKQTHQGAKNVHVEAHMSEWVDPDADPDTAVPTEFTKLPSFTDEE